MRQIAPVEDLWTSIFTDSAYFVRGAALPSQALLGGANGDISFNWAEQVRRHGERVRVYKVPAHKTMQDVQLGVLSIRAYLGNLVADKMAGLAV